MCSLFKRFSEVQVMVHEIFHLNFDMPCFPEPRFVHRASARTS